MNTSDANQNQSIGSSIIKPINQAPCFEFQGSWSEGYLLAKTDGQSSVIVGPGLCNPNVFAQQIDVNGLEYIRLVARASGVREAPKTRGALQVNWLSVDGDCLSCTRHVFEVTTFHVSQIESIYAVPVGAIIAVLYVVPGDDESCVEYFEMSAYASSGALPFPARLVHSTNSVLELPSAAIRPDHFWARDWNNLPLYFTHIPKTAGHSVYSVLQSNYTEESVVLPYEGVEGNCHKFLEIPKVDGVVPYKVFAGHMPSGIDHYAGEGKYITLLRDPVELVISAYFFNMEQPQAPHYALQTFLNRSIVQFGEFYDNILTRYLATSSFVDCTYWMSNEMRPDIANNSYLGLDFGRGHCVKSFALQQWNGPLNGGRYTKADVLSGVVVECSNDNFLFDKRLVARLKLRQTRDMVTYCVPNNETARYWRVRAIEDSPTARWAVVSLRFFEVEMASLQQSDFERFAIQGVPICSSYHDGFSADKAFDGHDRQSLRQIPPGALEKSHFEEAIENLRNKYLIGLVDQYELSIKLFSKVLSWNSASFTYLNQGGSRRNYRIISDRERRDLMEINRFDVGLYEFAKRLFKEDIKRIFKV